MRGRDLLNLGGEGTLRQSPVRGKQTMKPRNGELRGTHSTAIPGAFPSVFARSSSFFTSHSSALTIYFSK
jgi:hypothetical protein